MPATFMVNTNTDTPDANPGDGLARDAAGMTSLRAAVQEANALYGNNGADREHMITFTEAMTVNLTASMDNFVANIMVNQAREVPIGGVLDPVVISGNGTFRLFDIQAGSTSSFGGPFQICSGQGAFINWGTLSLGDCEIFNNSAGGIDNWGSMEIWACDIHSNTNGSGGGIRCHKDSSTVIDYGTQIYDNTTDAEGDGGGISVDGGATVDVWNSQIYGNTAGGDGGGVYSEGTFNMHNGSIYLNVARGYILMGQQLAGYGGGLFNAHINGPGHMTLIGVTIERNTASVLGGAMYLGRDTDTDLEGCTLRNDVSGTGNGPGIARHNTATLEMNGCTNDDGLIYIIN